MTSPNKINQGIELWDEIAELINAEIAATGELSRNNKAIWRILNTWTNKEWLAILQVVSLVQEQQPKLFAAYHNKSLAEAAKILVNLGSTHSRVLDTKGHKDVYWKMVMSLREVWNNMKIKSSDPQELFYA